MSGKRGIAFSAVLGVLLLSFYLSGSTAAQDDEKAAEVPDPFTNRGLYAGGLTFIGSDAYVRLQLQPDIPLGEVGMGLDLVLLYNPYAEGSDPQILLEDAETWESPSTWLRLIRYVRYGQPNDPFHLRFGALDYLTIGHGSIMSGYSNYDRRGVRLNLRNPENRYGVETLLNDVGNPAIFGGRAFLRPFLRGESSNFLTRFEVGATYLTDINPNLEEASETPLTAVGLDVGLPIFETGTFRLDIYDDIAFLEKSSSQTDQESSETASGAWGNAVGIGFSAAQAVFRIEYRTFGEGYTPSLFDYTYESAKSVVPPQADPLFLGVAADTGPKRGFFSQLRWIPLPQIHFLGTFEDYTNAEPKLYVGLAAADLIPRLSARAFYTKRNIGAAGGTRFFEDLFDLDEKSAFSVEVRYELVPPVVTTITREYRFRRVEAADGSSRFEPIHKTSFTVGVSTDF